MGNEGIFRNNNNIIIDNNKYIFSRLDAGNDITCIVISLNQHCLKKFSYKRYFTI